MDIMDLLSQARPGRLDPGPENDRRASDLARAIAAPRTGMTAPPTPARVIAIRIGVAALMGTAGAVVALSATGTHAGTAAVTSKEVGNAILTAFTGVGGDVFYNKITETYPDDMSKYDGVSQSWAYPLQPQDGQKAYVRYLYAPNDPGGKTDAELIVTEPGGGSQPGSLQVPVPTRVIDVQYDSRTWSDTTAPVAVESETGDLQALRESIVNGELTYVRKTELNGQTVLELTADDKVAGQDNTQTWWVDPATYLPVRSLSTGSDVATIQVDYGFLPPTPANIAEVNVTIPAGFTRTPAIQK